MNTNIIMPVIFSALSLCFIVAAFRIIREFRKIKKGKVSREITDCPAVQEHADVKSEVKTPEYVQMDAKQGNFSETYLKNRKITDRQQLYVCGDVYEKISRYLRVIGDGKISMTSYVNNVLYQHIAEHRDIINDLYDSKVSKPL